MKLTSIFGLLSMAASVAHAAPIAARSASPLTPLEKAVADIRKSFGWDRPVQAREALAEPSLDGAVAEIRKNFGWNRPVQAREALAEPILNVDADFDFDSMPLESSSDILDLKEKVEAGSKDSDVREREAKFIVGSKPLPAAQIPKFWDFVKDKVKTIVGKGSKRSEMAKREASSSVSRTIKLSNKCSG